MALEFEAAAAAPTPPFSITGTPYYIAMFNAAGDNVGDTNIKRNVGVGFDVIEFKSPNRTKTPWGFSCADTLNDSTFRGQLSYGTFLMDSGSAQFGTRFKLDSGTSGAISLETSIFTQVPIIDLFDYQHTNHAYIKNDDGLQFVSTDDKSVIFSQTTQDGSIDLRFGNDSSEIVLLSTDAQINIVAEAGVVSLIEMTNGSGDSFINLNVNADDTDTYIELRQATTTIFRADDAGISTDGTNFIKFLAASATAPTPDSKIEVIVNGATYLIAAELVP